MSKSLGDKHYVGVFDSEDAIRKKVKTAVTDTGSQPGGEMSPGVANLFTIIKACGNMQAWEELNKQFLNGTLKYSELKGTAADSLVATLKPLREKRTELNSNRSLADGLMHESSARARDFAEKVLDEVKELTGLFK
jgi:tryptophanyl-tRNA synthetase